MENRSFLKRAAKLSESDASHILQAFETKIPIIKKNIQSWIYLQQKLS